jgi:O-antigen/teichoic acid export membrane protein
VSPKRKHRRADLGRSEDNLLPKIRRSSRALLVAQLVSQAISILTVMMCYRLLDQQHYGLLGMALPAILLGRTLATHGLNVASIQEQSITDSQHSQLFWIGLRWAAVSTAVCCCVIPLLALLFGAPEMLAVGLALTGTIVIAAVGNQHQSRLERNFDFRRLATIRIAAQIVGAISAISAALLGAGVWSLVLQQYSELLVLSLLLWISDNWRPRWTGSEISDLSASNSTHLVRFSSYYSLSSLAFFIGQNIDKLFLAWLLGSTPRGLALLGMYSQAFQWMQKPVLLTTSLISGVMVPALSRTRQVPKQYAALAIDFYRLTATLLFPSAIGLFVIADDVMLVLGGPKWAAAGYVLQALAIAIIGQGLINITGSVFASTGRADRLFFASLVINLALIQGYFCGYWLATRHGFTQMNAVLGVAWGYSLTTVFAILGPYLAFSFMVARLPFTQLIFQLLKVLLHSAIMGVAVFALKRSLDSVTIISARLIVLIGAGAVIYLLLARHEVKFLVNRFLRDAE